MAARWASALVGACLVVALLVGSAAASAGAATFGQIGEPWGGVGTGSGQFFNPGMLGVDSSTGDIYTGDYTSTDKSTYRIQKFTESGNFLASVAVSKKEEGKLTAVHGIAVDPDLGRFYVVQGCRVVPGTDTCGGVESFGALHVLAFDTTQSGQALAQVGVFDLPVGSEELYNPVAIAVDPSSNDILLLAENAGKHMVVQRVHANGEMGARFTDTANVLRPSTGVATALAVGLDGTAYTLTGNGGVSTGAKDTRAWELPPDLSEIKEVASFADAAESEGWHGHLKSVPGEAFFGGPTIAISPDGKTLSWKEQDAAGSQILIRGYSLVDHETRMLYGGGTSRCQVQTEAAGLGTAGENLVVFDYGPTLSKTTQKPSFGYHVEIFGPGGTGCPPPPSKTPVAKFTINGEPGDDISVGERESVEFDASNSQLRGSVARELIWDFGDGKQEVLKCPLVGGECDGEAALTTTHKYTSVCECSVTLEIKLEKSPGGDPVPVQHTLKVEFRAPPKMFPLSVAKDGTGAGLVSSDRTGIYCGGVCNREFEENRLITLIPAAASGSVFAGWGGGCVGSGLCQVTMNAAKSVTATFDAVLPSPLLPTLSPAVDIPPRAGVTPEKTKPKPRPKPKKVPPKCRKLKGKARARCVAKHQRGKSSNHTGHGRPGSRRGSR